MSSVHQQEFGQKNQNHFEYYNSEGVAYRDQERGHWKDWGCEGQEGHCLQMKKYGSSGLDLCCLMHQKVIIIKGCLRAAQRTSHLSLLMCVHARNCHQNIMASPSSLSRPPISLLFDHSLTCKRV